MTTEIDAEGLEAARYAVRFALMSGEVGTMGAAEIAIRAYLASTRTSEAEPVARVLEAFHDAKSRTFPDAPALESFARGVEEGLLKAVVILRTRPTSASDDQVEAVLSVDALEALILETEPDVPACVDGSKIWTRRMAKALHDRLAAMGVPSHERDHVRLSPYRRGGGLCHGGHFPDPVRPQARDVQAMTPTDTLREAVATEACVYDKTGRAIMRGDVVKVLHFTDERGHKRYMYKQCLGPGAYRSGKHQYVMFSHLNFIEDPSVRNGPYHEHPGAHLPHYEIVQSIDAKWRDRPRAAPRLDATVRSEKEEG